MNDELVNKEWPIVIKNNLFGRCCGWLLVGIFLILGLSLSVMGIYCLGIVFQNSTDNPPSKGDLFFVFSMAIIFLFLAYRTVVTIKRTPFRIAADEKGLCISMGGKYIFIPNEYITSIWVGENYIKQRGGNVTHLVIMVKKDFSPYSNSILNYFFRSGGHKFCFRRLELGMPLLEAQALLKTYWKPVNS